MAAVSSAYGDRRTMGVTAVNNAADGRRTTSITTYRAHHQPLKAGTSRNNGGSTVSFSLTPKNISPCRCAFQVQLKITQKYIVTLPVI